MDVEWVLPGNLRMPRDRPRVDDGKLFEQLARHRTSTQGMPPLPVVRCEDGVLMIVDGVTRATRVLDVMPAGTRVPAVIVGDEEGDFSGQPTVATQSR